MWDTYDLLSSCLSRHCLCRTLTIRYLVSPFLLATSFGRSYALRHIIISTLNLVSSLLSATSSCHSYPLPLVVIPTRYHFLLFLPATSCCHSYPLPLVIPTRYLLLSFLPATTCCRSQPQSSLHSDLLGFQLNVCIIQWLIIVADGVAHVLQVVSISYGIVVAQVSEMGQFASDLCLFFFALLLIAICDVAP